MKNIVILIISFFILIISCNNNGVKQDCLKNPNKDYILFKDFKTNNLLFVDTYFNLMKAITDSCVYYYQHLRHYESTFDKKKYDTILILKYPNQGVEYFRYKDSVQLYSIDIEKNKSAKIYLFDKKLNRKTTISDFCNYFDIDKTSINEVNAYWTHYPDTTMGYAILWISDTTNHGYMEFYFDVEEKLKYINFGLKNGGIY